jgi:S-DNA-T family DNA segregation ATPase FtsK/SpoIIIE
MGRLPRLFGVGSGWMLEILPSVAAAVIGGYLLAQLHFGRATEPATSPPANVAATTDEPTVSEDRAAMRQVLKERREKPEQPAQVRPIAAAVPASVPAPPPMPTRPAVTAAIPLGMDSISPREPVARPAAAANRPNVAAAAATPAAPRPDAELDVYVPAPPPGLPPAPARGMDAPTVIVPSVATATAPPATPPNAPPAAPTEPHGPVGVVFSTVSSFVGHAANATGHTVNWVIDLPGKAISAGGRVIGVTPPPPPPSPRPFS